MWTAEILSAKANGDGETVTVTYKISNGIQSRTVTEPRVSRVDKISIWRLAQDAADAENRAEAQQLAVSNFDPTSVVGAVDFSSLTPILTPEEIEAQAFVQKVVSVERSKSQVDRIAILRVASKEVADALDANPEFADLL